MIIRIIITLIATLYSYPTGFEVTNTQYIYKVLHSASYTTANVEQIQGPYTITGFQASTSERLKPLYSVVDFQFYRYTWARSVHKVYVQIVSAAGNTTIYRIILQFNCNTLASLKTRIFFFDDSLLDTFYTFQVQYMPSPIYTNKYTQLNDLRVIFNNASFVYDRDQPIVFGYVACKQQYAIFGCFYPSGETINFALFNQTHIQFNFSFASSYCTGSYNHKNLTINIIMYSPIWLSQNTNLLLTDDTHSVGRTGATATLTTTYAIFSPHNVPQDFVFYGLYSFRMWDTNSIRWTYTQTFNIGPPTSTTIRCRILGGGDMALGVWTVGFYKIICPFGDVHDKVSNSCVASCPSRTYMNSTIQKFNVSTCSSCHYSCDSCIDNISCQTCDSIIDRRTMNASTLLCDPLPRFYDDQLNNSITLNCFYSCYTCQYGSNCTSCDLFNDHRVFNTTTLLCDPISGYTDDGTNNSVTQPCYYTCMTCSNMATCLTCDSAYFRVMNSSTLNCDPMHGYYDDGSNNTAFRCYYTCDTCLDGLTCQTCDSSLNRIFNSNISACDPTSCHVDDGVNSYACFYTCKTCNSTPFCISCDTTNNRILNGSSLNCDPIDGYFDDGLCDPVTKKCQPWCRTCTQKAAKCTSCYDEFQHKPEFVCTKGGCISFIWKIERLYCIACDAQNHFVYQPSNFSCTCQVGYKAVLNSRKVQYDCQSVCGDGIHVIQQDCDDGNLINDDGCSSSCTVQSDFQCSRSSPSVCILYHNFVRFSYNYAYKVEKANKYILSFTLQPSHRGLINMNLNSLMQFNVSANISSSISYSYAFSTGQLLVKGQFFTDLQNLLLQSQLQLPASKIVSIPSIFYQTDKLNGVNAQLIIYSQTQKTAYEIQSNISLVLTILLLIQFLLGSYSHKMIGVQTIHTIQLFYFTKMIVFQQETTLLDSLNDFKYSVNGYSISNLLFDIQPVVGTNLGYDTFTTMDPQFMRIGINKYFIVNVNLFLGFYGISLIVYLIQLARKYYKRNLYMRNQLPETKDQYVILKRSCNWIYDRFIFPLSMFLCMISFFNLVSYQNSLPEEKNITQSQYAFIPQYTSMISISYSLQACVFCFTLCIYANELFQSFKSFFRSKMTVKQKQKLTSKIEKLQHDENSGDKINYHYLYIMVYLIWILGTELFLVCGVMIPEFEYGLECFLGLCSVYFIFIVHWKPYREVAMKHNYFIIFNQVALLAFVSICLAFQRGKNLNLNIYISLISVMLFVLLLVLIGGFVRILIQYWFRKWLEQNQTALDDNNAQQNQQNQQNLQLIRKKETNLKINPYLFEHQVLEFIRKKEPNIQNSGKKYNQKSNQNKNIQQKQQQIQIIQKMQRIHLIESLKSQSIYQQFVKNNQPLTKGLRQKLKGQQQKQSKIGSKRHLKRKQTEKIT